MCMICVDDAVMFTAIVVAATPWYKSIWYCLCGAKGKK